MTGDPPFPWNWSNIYGFCDAPYSPYVFSPQLPRCIMVNVPLPEYDCYETIVTVDKEGNVSIKVNQLKKDE